MYFDKFDNYEEVAHEKVKPPLVSRTFDGLEIHVKVSFQWRLDPAYLKGIYKILGGAEDLLEDMERPDDKPSFVETVMRLAQGTLTQTCAEYSASQFFANQTVVEERMLQALKDAFNKPDKGFIIYIQDLQLRTVDLPRQYEESIAQTQREEQDLLTAIAERDTKEVQMSTQVMLKEQQQLELLKAAEANASKIAAENSAWVEQYMLFQTKQAHAFAQILNELKDSSDPYESLFELMRQKALKDHKADALTVSM